MSLRPRQLKAVEDVRAAYRKGIRAPILCAATGFGKTHTAAEIIRGALEKGRTVWFLAHLREILDDTGRRLDQAGISYGEIGAGKPFNYERSVQIVSVQSAVRRDDLPWPDLVIVDECHLAVANTYKKVLASVGDPPLLGLTGTPYRLDGRGLNELFDLIIPTCSTQDLIDEGLLAPVRYFAPYCPDLSKVKTQMGDYKVSELEEHMNTAQITGNVVEHYRKHCEGKRAVAFCTSIKHSEAVASNFRAHGYKAVAISGESKPCERRDALKGLKDGSIQVVCNAQLWVAGVDVPEIECIILLRPTKSVTFYLQAIGRGLRTAPGKDGLIVLDHAGCVFHHGVPTKARQWDLRGRPKKEQAPDVKQCPACFAAHEPAPVCPECGFVYPKPKHKPLKTSEEDLSEIDLKKAAELEKKKQLANLRREQARARTLKDLIALGERRQYKYPVAWAKKIMASRKFV